MPIKFHSSPASESLNQPHTELDIRVASATNVLLNAIGILSQLVKPKTLEVSATYLRRFEQVDSDESRHTIRITSPKDEAVDEVAEWQIMGTVQNRIVNVIVYGVFHTYKHNRSGGYELFINGKNTYLRKELGGLAVDDIWQDTGKYKEFYEATTRHIIKQGNNAKGTK